MTDIVPDEMTLHLKRPIKLQDREITSIDLCEPTAYQIQQVQKVADKDGSQASNIALVALVSGLLPAEIGLMKISDLNKATAFLSPFIMGAPGTGNG